MEIIRVIKNKNYSIIANGIFRDTNISLKAKGLLGILLSLPTSWDLSIMGLTKITKEGKHSITNTINELIKNGYIERNTIRSQGKFNGYQYIVYEKPKSAKPISVDPLTAKRTQLNKENNKLSINKDNKWIKEVEESDYKKEMKREFIAYWLESNGKGKTKQSMQKTWCTTRRLATWAKNDKKWSKNPSSKIEQQMDSYKGAIELLDKQYEIK